MQDGREAVKALSWQQVHQITDRIQEFSPYNSTIRFLKFDKVTSCLQELENLVTEFGVAVEEDVAVATGKRQSVAQLMHDPIARRMCCDIEV